MKTNESALILLFPNQEHFMTIQINESPSMNNDITGALIQFEYQCFCHPIREPLRTLE